MNANLWACEAKAAGHDGSRWFHVIAYTQPEAARLAALEAPSAGSIRLKLVENEAAADRLWDGAVNFADWWEGQTEPEIDPYRCPSCGRQNDAPHEPDCPYYGRGPVLRPFSPQPAPKVDPEVPTESPDG